MKHVRTYQENQAMGNRLLPVAEGLLGHMPWWNRAKVGIDPTTLLRIDGTSKREEEAHFDVARSTPKEVVILMAHTPPQSRRDQGSLAHELTHAIQWLSKGFGDLMYITDVTRDLAEISDSELWEKLLYAIYLSCPQETQAWQAESQYHREPILDEMVPWMRSFDPIRAASELQATQIKPNRWGISGFDDLPAFWAEAYEIYDEPTPNSEIPAMRGVSLTQFLTRYSRSFKEASTKLS